MKEVFKPLQYAGEDYGDFYEVSDQGHIRGKKTKKIVKTRINNKGVEVYCGSLGGRKKNKLFRVGKAVADTFLPNPEGKPYVVHLDGDKSNNKLDNLERMTSKESATYNYETGKMFPPSQEHMKRPVIMIDIETGKHIQRFSSAGEAGEFLGDKYYRKHISQVCNGQRYSAYGYRWKHAE